MDVYSSSPQSHSPGAAQVPAVLFAANITGAEFEVGPRRRVGPRLTAAVAFHPRTNWPPAICWHLLSSASVLLLC